MLLAISVLHVHLQPMGSYLDIPMLVAMVFGTGMYWLCKNAQQYITYIRSCVWESVIYMYVHVA